ncbi:MAG: amino acid adenylation domain-containing protein [Atopobiaceae bacterium]|nr:amino acid adenylation domain-containing protein [Atopobiaceae bacterium]
MKMRLKASASGEIFAERHDEFELQIRELDKSTLVHGFESLVHPFRLTEEPLVRAALIRDDSACWLFFDAHHLVFDGESMSVFFRDLNKAYVGDALETEAFTGFEAALAEKELRKSPAYGKAKEYFTKLLAGRDTDCLPVKDRSDSEPGTGCLTMDVSVPRKQVEQLLREQKITANALWNAAFGLTLSRFVARNDCVYATVYNGRNDSRLADSVGMFVHTFPVVCDVREGEDGRSFITRMGRQLTESMLNDVYSFAEISRELNVTPGVMFVYQSDLGEVRSIGGLPANATALQPNATKEELVFFVFDTENGYRIECEYEVSHYEEWHVRSIMEAMAVAAEALIHSQKPDEISLLSAQSKGALVAFNTTEKPVEQTDIATLFRRAANTHPGRIAVMFGDVRLTYRELDELSDWIAVYIQKLGIGREETISILIPRSEYMAITALGVLKSGAAYQPLDPSYPPEHLRFMVEGAHAKLLIADADLMHLLPEYDGPVLKTQEIGQLPEAGSPNASIKPEDLFILLYTSGTTGVPKGVMLEHRNLVNFCDWYRTYYDLTPSSVVVAYASFGFDACMMDMWPALTTGAAVCVVPEELRLNLPELNRHFIEKGVTHVFMTTQMGRMFASGIKGAAIRHLSVGGEKLVPLAPPEGYVLTNGYGPTECTIFSTVQPVDRLYGRIPIGKPLSNYKLYVTDKNGSELPVGAVGELWIAGHGVGCGYLNRPEMTEKAFAKNPFCTVEGFNRVYKTGDLVRRLSDGRIDFIGRNDGQVKVRGFRIELSEVEGVIREYSGIKDVTVQAFDSEADGKYIAAHVVADEPVDFNAVSSYILSKKPPYMVPAAWMQLDAIPLNQNQKVNRKALPVPAPTDESHEYVAPDTPVETELCNKFAEILGLERVGATDSFFDLGGSSISAAEIVMFAMNRGYSIVYKDVFNHPTARELAKVIAGVEDGKQSADVSDFDYTAIHDLISMNTMELVDEISSTTLGNVILAGATGFLGIHVLKAFLNNTDGTVTCLIRRSGFDSVEMRLKTMLMYYFEEPMEELFGRRIFCVEGDITDPDSLRSLDNTDASAVINCAASVKHFVKDDLLDRINYHGVENLIEVRLRNNMRLVQISTLSVGGFIEPENNRLLKEDMLFFNQNVDNDYVRTKFLAERAILSARVERGLNAVILRAGNLMGRNSDGEFQINFRTNSFCRALRAYVRLGVCPITVLEQPVEFSPIDAVAQAVLRLASVDSRFSVFNMYNNHTITMADVIGVVVDCGHPVEVIPQKQFREILAEAAKHEEESGDVLSLVAYNNKFGENVIPVEADCRFTTNALFRLDYRWPIIDNPYLEKVIRALDTLDFFADQI